MQSQCNIGKGMLLCHFNTTKHSKAYIQYQYKYRPKGLLHAQSKIFQYFKQVQSFISTHKCYVRMSWERESLIGSHENYGDKKKKEAKDNKEREFLADDTKHLLTTFIQENPGSSSSGKPAVIKCVYTLSSRGGWAIPNYRHTTHNTS